MRLALVSYRPGFVVATPSALWSDSGSQSGSSSLAELFSPTSSSPISCCISETAAAAAEGGASGGGITDAAWLVGFWPLPSPDAQCISWERGQAQVGCIGGEGHLVFVSSIVAELPSPGHAVYCASKFAVNGLAESLEYELAPQVIQVHLVGPGLVRTEFPKRAGVPQKRFEQMPSKSALEVAQAVIQAVERGQRKSVPDFFGRQAIKLRRHFPNLAHCIFKRVFRSF